MVWYNKLTVEVPLLFTFISFLLTGSIFTNLVVYRSCYVLLGYNKTECAQLGTETNNQTKNLEKLVEPTADVITMVKTVVDALLPVFVCMLAGPWSDKNGRKPVLLLTLIGFGLGPVIMVILCYFENLSPWYFLISSIPVQITGSTTTYFMITLSYLSDVSTPETRGLRMAVYEATVATGVLTGSLLGPFIYYSTNYETVFGIAAGCMLVGILYTMFFIPESLPRNEQNRDQNGTAIDLKYLGDMVYTSIKKRENYDRAIIILTIFSIIIFSFQTNGDYGIQFMFLREKLNWTLTKYNLYFAAHNILWVIGTMGGTFFLHKKLKIKESVLTMVGLASIFGCVILQAIATKDIYIYFAGFVRCLGGLTSPMLRSQVSRLVPPNEAGKIFTMILAGGALVGLGTSPLYTLVYNATININSAAFNFLSMGLLGLTFCLVLTIMTLERKSRSYPLKNEEETNVKIPK